MSSPIGEWIECGVYIVVGLNSKVWNSNSAPFRKAFAWLMNAIDECDLRNSLQDNARPLGKKSLWNAKFRSDWEIVLCIFHCSFGSRAGSTMTLWLYNLLLYNLVAITRTVQQLKSWKVSNGNVTSSDSLQKRSPKHTTSVERFLLSGHLN